MFSPKSNLIWKRRTKLEVSKEMTAILGTPVAFRSLYDKTFKTRVNFSSLYEVINFNYFTILIHLSGYSRYCYSFECMYRKIINLLAFKKQIWQLPLAAIINQPIISAKCVLNEWVARMDGEQWIHSLDFNSCTQTQK